MIQRPAFRDKWDLRRECRKVWRMAADRKYSANLVNPGPHLGWSLILGPLVIEAWDRAPGYAAILVAPFYVVMVFTLALIILLFGTTSSLCPKRRGVLMLLSSMVLAGIGIY